eukprot:CAMPEP_0171663098 /NCGR_PEP_ID=MMETSP0990-20121206/45973_1 /TAXON_ID=483369 /ORGANISM="non described non described, Strain CCMP2098" /LENGTH=70 /DNA_ID=CAMNT_0012245695 /DNA_START=172 /DNA_END=384 /DNA_ORIENTATION=+
MSRASVSVSTFPCHSYTDSTLGTMLTHAATLWATSEPAKLLAASALGAVTQTTATSSSALASPSLEPACR